MWKEIEPEYEALLKKGKVREDRIKSLKSHKDYGYTFETQLSTS